jgi:hypothetical protein
MQLYRRPLLHSGVGTLKIAKLAPNQKATKTKTGANRYCSKAAPSLPSSRSRVRRSNPPRRGRSRTGCRNTRGGMFLTTNIKFFGT